jgi:AMMECR1 domain-containing protein
LEHNARLTIKAEVFVPLFQEKRATFVTLHLNELLRGCAGSLSAHQTLIEDISSHAYSGVFRESRFPPLQGSEFEQLH